MTKKVKIVKIEAGYRNGRKKNKGQSPSGRILKDIDKKVVAKFIDNCKAEGLGVKRIGLYQRILRDISYWLKTSLEKAKRNDIEDLVQALNESNFKPQTLHDYKVTLKKFYKWYKGKNEDFPDEVRWLKSTIKQKDKEYPKDCLTEEEVTKLINASTSPRDKALVSTTYESGCRIGEILALKVGDIKFDNYGTFFIVNGKTGERPIRVVNSSPYLDDWINNFHPEGKNPEVSLWANKNFKNKAEAIKHNAVIHILRRLAKIAGITKAVNPHNFRHSKITELCRDSNWNESLIKKYVGWSKGSNQIERYNHIMGRDTEKTVLKSNGINIDEELKQEKAIGYKRCPHCSTINKPFSKFCHKCERPMEIQVAEEQAREIAFMAAKLVEQQQLEKMGIKGLEQMHYPRHIQVDNDFNVDLSASGTSIDFKGMKEFKPNKKFKGVDFKGY